MFSVQMETSLPETSASQGKKRARYSMKKENVSQEIQGLKINKGFTILLKKYSYAHLLI